MEKKELRPILWIDAAKGICIVMVVLYHVVITAYRSQYPADELLGALPEIGLHELVIAGLAPLRMPLFFMISGFLAARAALRSGWPEVANKRVTLFVYLYLLWSVIQWASVALMHALSGVVRPATEQAIYADSLPEYLGALLLGATDVWYLYALPAYFIACKLLARRPLVALLGFLALHTVGRLWVDSWPAGSILANGIYFCLGCFWGAPFFRRLTAPGLGARAALVLPLLAACLVTRLFWEDWQAIPTSLLAIALVVVGLERIQHRYPLRTLCWMGRNTLPIYVIHRIWIEIPDLYLRGNAVAPAEGAGAHAWYLLYPALMTMLTVALSLVTWWASNRGIGKCLYALPGGVRIGLQRRSSA
ncbi:acyltransferase family protein [Pseudorhodoferax sp.]|uniref:acyltransferase family protein n=1 Tax=Pseudorhodoferax sp. TaxID=1993553 RepID=UPI002DD666EF|nr:acyltransferase family protein [Pseudorhodoferax sp.]